MAETPTGETSQSKSIVAYRKPWESRSPRSWSEGSLKKEESRKKDRPDPKITKKLSER